MSNYFYYTGIFLHISISPYHLLTITLPITYQKTNKQYIYIFHIQNYLPIILHPSILLYLLLYHILTQYLPLIQKHKKNILYYYIPYYISITKNHTYIHIYIYLSYYIYIIIYYHLYSLTNTLIIPFIIYFLFLEI